MSDSQGVSGWMSRSARHAALAESLSQRQQEEEEEEEEENERNEKEHNANPHDELHPSVPAPVPVVGVLTSSLMAQLLDLADPDADEEEDSDPHHHQPDEYNQIEIHQTYTVTEEELEHKYDSHETSLPGAVALDSALTPQVNQPDASSTEMKLNGDRGLEHATIRPTPMEDHPEATSSLSASVVGVKPLISPESPDSHHHDHHLHQPIEFDSTTGATITDRTMVDSNDDADGRCTLSTVPPCPATGPPIPTSSALSMSLVAQRIIEARMHHTPKEWKQKTPTIVTATSGQSALQTVSNTEAAPATQMSPTGVPDSHPVELPIPILITHVIDQFIVPVDRPTAAKSVSGLQVPSQVASLLSSGSSLNSSSAFADLGSRLGSGLMRGSSLIKGRDIRHTWQSIARGINQAILTPTRDAAHRSQRSHLTSFLRSLGFACPPLLLYCLMHLLDQHIERAMQIDELDGFDASVGIDAAVSVLDGVDTDRVPNSNGTAAAPKPTSSVTPFDFMEQAYAVCQLIESILVSPLGPSAARSGSASLSVCESTLSALGMDWRQVWRHRFIHNRLRSHELTWMHPMIVECLWRIQGAVGQAMQVETIAQMTERG